MTIRMSTSFNFFALTKYAARAPTLGRRHSESSSSEAHSKPISVMRKRKKRGRDDESVLPRSKKQRKKKKNFDPSAKYLSNPLKCPIVNEFKSFFASICDANNIPTAKVYVGPSKGWRTVAKLSSRASRGSEKNIPEIGIFAPGSHNVIPLLHSDAHHPSINAAMKQVSESAIEVGIKGYNGRDHGGLSYVGSSVDLVSGLVQLVLVFNASSVEEEGKVLLKHFVTHLCQKRKWHSIWYHFHKASRHDNSIFGREGSKWEIAYGSNDPVTAVLDLPTSTLDPAPILYFPPQVFRQANLAGFTRIIQEIRKWLNPQGHTSGRACKCVELYGGVGTIGLNVLDLVDELSCSDSNPFNEKCFLRTRDSLAKREGRKAYYSTSGAADMALAGELSGPIDVLIVDPPRKGLDKEVLEKLTSSTIDPPHRIIYVSCGFKAFCKDYKELSSMYRPVHCEGHVLFPGSNHIETLCVFDRLDNSESSHSLSQSHREKTGNTVTSSVTSDGPTYTEPLKVEGHRESSKKRKKSKNKKNKNKKKRSK